MFGQQDYELYLMHVKNYQGVLSFCYSARTREGVQLAFEELVEKVQLYNNPNYSCILIGSCL